MKSWDTSVGCQDLETKIDIYLKEFYEENEELRFRNIDEQLKDLNENKGN